ncbi:MAG TPA: peptide chain release factor N(5)-glutamine methyltransferase [Candidatus Binatia bacterium]|nr:peptide chain release factor N(5)-glutamine methyltransferase [Candidatus Binatia bacterium]
MAIMRENPPSIRNALSWGAQVLRQAGIENGRLDAEVLLRHVLEMEKERLYSSTETLMSTGQEAKFRELVLRRARREPVTYITGHKEFWSLDFMVSPGVLIPRPETELLVEIALQYIGRSSVKILDLGTGSGAISVCIAKEKSAAEIVAVDVSRVALDTARVNAARHGVAGRIRFLLGDLFAPVKPLREIFDVIMSNPPYIRTGELSTLAPEISEWEPMTALDGGADGIEAYRRIIGEGHEYLAPAGAIVLEIGSDMVPAVTELFNRSGCYGPPSVYQDYAGKDRVIAAVKWPPSDTAAERIEGG